ncbi:PaaI family thioesterase [Aureispira anguillae]|uniref:Medium/long-chain acyl-CoA thioesterase YigI n=1 Tax=Aureispira anguillae TaxID=2864201 RepID=A0A916DU45_9BACT|nr:hotdog fold thioesterase [Aureispira anguillae]BDS12250.1 hotdog fold thioesterase [Aureispira anguillae]
MKVDLNFVKDMVEEQIPIHKFLGVKLVEIRRNYAKVHVPFQEAVLGDIIRRRWHGGILATIMDSVGGLAGMTHLTSFEDKMATIDLRVDYLKGAEAKDIFVEGEIVRLGNRILVTSMKVWDETETELLAEGKGVYNFIRMKDKVLVE